MAMPLPLARRPCLGTLAAAVGLAFLSSLYFARLWTGVLVLEAGTASSNGYYVWKDYPTGKGYLKSSSVSPGGSRIPNAYDSVSRPPIPMKRFDGGNGDGTGLIVVTHAKGGGKERWSLFGDGSQRYRHRNGAALSNTPPDSGWEVVGRKEQRGLGGQEPPPQVHVCGRPVPPEHDLENLEKGDFRKAFEPGTAFSEVLAHPITTCLLLVNLCLAYYIWAKRVRPDAVAVSYALFWEEKQYWRLFTASFSHFEPLHLIFNAMGIWNTRHIEPLLGSFRLLYLTLDLVVTTIFTVILVKHALVRWTGSETQRRGQAVGFSCVLFAYMTCLAVAMRQFCPLGTDFLCFKTWVVQMPAELPSLPLNLGPFGSLLLAQVMMPRAGFLGHLAGIVMGYAMAWKALDGLSTPILAGVLVVFMLQHSRGWARSMPDFSLLLQGWEGGDPWRVGRARLLSYVLGAELCIFILLLFLFSWGTGLGELLAVVVGFNAVQALKCCCCPDSVSAEHMYCVNLLKAYGALSAIHLFGDVLGFGAIVGQSCYLEWSGISLTRQHIGLAFLVIAAVVHGMAVLGCVEALAMLRDGQTFLSSIGLGRFVTAYSVNSAASSLSAGVTSGTFYRGGGRVLGSVASNRAQASAGARSVNQTSVREELLERRGNAISGGRDRRHEK